MIAATRLRTGGLQCARTSCLAVFGGAADKHWWRLDESATPARWRRQRSRGGGASDRKADASARRVLEGGTAQADADGQVIECPRCRFVQSVPNRGAGPST